MLNGVSLVKGIKLVLIDFNWTKIDQFGSTFKLIENRPNETLTKWNYKKMMSYILNGSQQTLKVVIVVFDPFLILQSIFNRDKWIVCIIHSCKNHSKE